MPLKKVIAGDGFVQVPAVGGAATLPITVPPSTTAVEGSTSGSLATDGSGNLAGTFLTVEVNDEIILDGGNAEISSSGGSIYVYGGGVFSNQQGGFEGATVSSIGTPATGSSRIGSVGSSGSGVMTIANDVDGVARKAAQIVSSGSVSIGGYVITGGGIYSINVIATGCLPSDLVSVTLDTPQTVDGNGGGVVIQQVQSGTGSFNVIFFYPTANLMANTTLAGNLNFNVCR